MCWIYIFARIAPHRNLGIMVDPFERVGIVSEERGASMVFLLWHTYDATGKLVDSRLEEFRGPFGALKIHHDGIKNDFAIYHLNEEDGSRTLCVQIITAPSDGTR